MTKTTRAAAVVYLRRCKTCGRKFSAHQQRLSHNDICPECASWWKVIDRAPEGLETLNGITSIYGEAYKPKAVKDMTLEEMLEPPPKPQYFLTPDGTPIQLTRLHSIGRPTGKWRNIFPDTLWEIDSKTYRKIKRNLGFVCHKKGCYDRYHCHWYDADSETEGPWNKIPSWHTPGWEQCPLFINQQTLILK